MTNRLRLALTLQPRVAKLSDSQRASDDNNRYSSDGVTLKQFLDSREIDYEKWHDGIGYDISAIDKLTPEERESVVKLLISKQPPTWRDLEALSHINTPAARQAVKAALKHPSIEVRIAASRYAENGDDNDRELHL